MPKNAIKDQLDLAGLIKNGYEVGSPELQTRLNQVGYTSTVMAQLTALLDCAQGARSTALGERGDRSGATVAVKVAQQQAEARVSVLSQIAGTVFANDIDARTTLGLEMPKPPTPATPATGDPTAQPPHAPERDQSLAGLLDRGRILYGNALSHAELQAELTKVGYPAARLQQELADLNVLAEADAVQEREKGEATAATADQAAALAELKQWIQRFRGIVVPALKDKPELLKSLGLKSRGGKRQKRAE